MKKSSNSNKTDGVNRKSFGTKITSSASVVRAGSAKKINAKGEGTKITP